MPLKTVGYAHDTEFLWIGHRCRKLMGISWTRKNHYSLVPRKAEVFIRFVLHTSALFWKCRTTQNPILWRVFGETAPFFWRNVPVKVCMLHDLSEASRTSFDVNRTHSSSSNGLKSDSNVHKLEFVMSRRSSMCSSVTFNCRRCLTMRSIETTSLADAISKNFSMFVSDNRMIWYEIVRDWHPTFTGVQ